jgi:hypothetical protein
MDEGQHARPTHELPIVDAHGKTGGIHVAHKTLGFVRCQLESDVDIGAQSWTPYATTACAPNTNQRLSGRPPARGPPGAQGRRVESAC